MSLKILIFLNDLFQTKQIYEGRVINWTATATPRRDYEKQDARLLTLFMQLGNKFQNPYAIHHPVDDLRELIVAPAKFERRVMTHAIY